MDGWVFLDGFLLSPCFLSVYWPEWPGVTSKVLKGVSPVVFVAYVPLKFWVLTLPVGSIVPAWPMVSGLAGLWESR